MRARPTSGAHALSLPWSPSLSRCRPRMASFCCCTTLVKSATRASASRCFRAAACTKAWQAHRVREGVVVVEEGGGREGDRPDAAVRHMG